MFVLTELNIIDISQEKQTIKPLGSELLFLSPDELACLATGIQPGMRSLDDYVYKATSFPIRVSCGIRMDAFGYFCKKRECDSGKEELVKKEQSRRRFW